MGVGKSFKIQFIPQNGCYAEYIQIFELRLFCKGINVNRLKWDQTQG